MPTDTVNAKTGDSLVALDPVRIVAALVIVVAIAVLASMGFASAGVWVFVLGCVAAGATIPLASYTPVTDRINGWQQFFSRRYQENISKAGKFRRWFLRPLFGGNLKIWMMTEGVANTSVRAGIRLTLSLYFWSLMFVALVIAAYVAAILAVFAIVLMVGLWILSNMGNDSEAPAARPRRASSWFTTECGHCGSNDHATASCPHDPGVFGFGGQTECGFCGSKDHASADCPHDSGVLGIGARTACSYCGSNSHASSDCPHDSGMLGIGAQTECSYCGSKKHASARCPHDPGLLGIGGATECGRCGSKEHASSDCPH